MSGSGFGIGGFGSESFSAEKFYTVSSMIDAVLNATSQATTDQSARSRILDFINARYLQILKGKHWNFLNREEFIDFKAPEETGTVSVTNNLPTVTGDHTVFSSNHIGQLFQLKTKREGYRIENVATNESLTVYPRIVSETVSDSDYSIFFDRYTINAAIKEIRSISINGVQKLALIGPQELSLRKQSNMGLSGIPKFACVQGLESESSQITIEVFPAPDQAYAVNIDYVLRPVKLTDEDDCYFLIPDYHLDVIYYAALADAYRALGDPTNSSSSRQDAMISYTKLSADQAATDSTSIMQGARNYFNRAAKRSRARGFFGLKWFGRVD